MVLPLAVVGLVVVGGLSASAATSTSTTVCVKAGSVLVAPPDIADRVEEILRDGPPTSPVTVAGVVLP